MAPAFRPLFSVVVLAALLGSPPARSAQHPDHQTQLRDRLAQALLSLDRESLAIPEREREARASCLSRWVQSACLESVRQQRLRDERALLLSKESLAESLRRIDAQERSHARAARQEELNAR